jgi:hypothetical protein
MSTHLRSSLAFGFQQKRTLFISDHRNNQLNSRINKKADQENWDTTHPIIMRNLANNKQAKAQDLTPDDPNSDEEPEANQLALQR